ncbi:MAG: arginine decarboxylase, partial [Geopsychrobacter sp.]|nr:arginine decarboxylase [Geopsychrobacter sp.]
MKITADSHWSPEDSRNLYGIKRWGAGRFIINEQGQVCVQAELENKAVEVPLPEIIDGIRQRGYQLPVLIRFTDLLESSLRQ